MGIFCSIFDQAYRKNREAENIIIKGKETDSKITKLLLLGTGDSGKSTILKQIRLIANNLFTDEERLEYVSIIRFNIIRGFQTLINGTRTLFNETKIAISTENQNYARDIINHENHNVITPDLVTALRSLWSDCAMQVVFKQSNKIPLEDSIDYYMERIDDIQKPDYIPTDNDIIRSRFRTSGVITMEFKYNDKIFHAIDVGGQRNERNKWISHFEDVDAVLFVVACSEFDQLCQEDMKTNRMEESFTLFSSICHSPFFENTSFILFFNKVDILERKLASSNVNLGCFFEEFRQQISLRNVLDYIKKRFKEKFDDARKGVDYKNDNRPSLYIYETNATSFESISKAFKACEGIILKGNLDRSNIL